MTKTTSTTPALWLVRHAPVLAAPGLCYGATNLPADASATRAAAERLAKRLPEGTRVVSSPLQRCELLAQTLLGLRPDLIYTIDARLREMDFGAWELRPWDDVPRADMDAWLSDFANAQPGGHGESVRTLMTRVAAAWDEARTAPDQPLLWVTHAGVMRAAQLLAQGAPMPTQPSDWPNEDLPFGQVRTLPLA